MGCLKKIFGCIGFLVVVIAGAAALMYFLLVPQLTGRIEDGLRKKLELGPSATVKITDTGLLALSKGRIEKVSVHASEARVERLVVNDLSFEATGLQFDLFKTILMNDPAISSLGEGRLEFTVRATALQAAWETAASKIGISDLKVSLIPKDLAMKLEGVWTVPAIKKEYPFEATGKLNVTGGSLLFFEFPDVTIGDYKIGIASLQSALGKVGPRINLGDYKVKLELDDVSFSQTGLTIRANAFDAGGGTDEED